MKDQECGKRNFEHFHSLAKLFTHQNWAIRSMIIAIYLAGCGILTLRFGWLISLNQRILKDATQADDRMMAIANEVRSLTGNVDFRLAVANTAIDHITFGFLKPWIVLPESSLNWTESHIKSLLIDEASHIERGDWL